MLAQPDLLGVCNTEPARLGGEGRKPETFEDVRSKALAVPVLSQTDAREFCTFPEAWHRKVHESHHAHAEASCLLPCRSFFCQSPVFKQGQAEQLALRQVLYQGLQYQTLGNIHHTISWFTVYHTLCVLHIVCHTLAGDADTGKLGMNVRWHW